MLLATKLALAATLIATSLGASTTVGLGMECRQLCEEFLPHYSLTHEGSYDCQDAIDDTGGTCTINGRANVHKELPRGIGYRGGDYYYGGDYSIDWLDW